MNRRLTVWMFVLSVMAFISVACYCLSSLDNPCKNHLVLKFQYVAFTINRLKLEVTLICNACLSDLLHTLPWG